MAKTRRVSCRNRRQTERRCGNNADWPECQGCPLVYTHLSDRGPSNDIVRCDSPIPIKYGDMVEIVPQTARLIEPDSTDAAKPEGE